MQKKLLLSLVLALGILSGILVGAIAGRVWLAPETSIRSVVSSQTILTALRDQGFLVTQTYLFDQPVVINKTTGNPFKDFFVGQTVEARGTMEANLGLDLSKLTTDDITVSDDQILVRIPPPSLFNTRLVGPIEVRNTQGLLKKLFGPDDGYNLALEELTRASTAAAAKPEILKNAQDKSVKEISRLVELLTKESGKSVKVEVK
ncbi:MAG: DUF4230 domain-containing protein [Candidatus Uhrbacteria bacterium]